MYIYEKRPTRETYKRDLRKRLLYWPIRVASVRRRRTLRAWETMFDACSQANAFRNLWSTRIHIHRTNFALHQIYFIYVYIYDKYISWHIQRSTPADVPHDSRNPCDQARHGNTCYLRFIHREISRFAIASPDSSHVFKISIHVQNGHVWLKGGSEALENEINELLGSKCDGFPLVQKVCWVRFA